MRLKKLKFTTRRRRRKNNAVKDDNIRYKCLLLGPNADSKNVFLDELNTKDHRQSAGTNEGALKLENSECVFWKADPKCEKNKFCIKQYIDFHSPDIIFYFVDIVDDDDWLERSIQRLETLMEVVQEDQSFCIVFDQQYIDTIEDLNMDQELFKENVMRLISLKIDFPFQYCFSDMDGMRQILVNLASAGHADNDNHEDIEDLTTEADTAWEEFCDIGGHEEYFLAPLPVRRDVEKKNGTSGDVKEDNDGGSWLGDAGLNIVESC